MYNETSGRIDLLNITPEEALRLAPSPTGYHSYITYSPLTRVEVVTPSGTYVLGCATGSTAGDVKRLLLEQVRDLVFYWH